MSHIPMLSSWWVKRCGVVWCYLLGRTDLGLQFHSFKWMDFVSQFLWSPQQSWFLQQLNMSPAYQTQRKFCLLPLGLLWYSHLDVGQMLEMCWRIEKNDWSWKPLIWWEELNLLPTVANLDWEPSHLVHLSHAVCMKVAKSCWKLVMLKITSLA